MGGEIRNFFDTSRRKNCDPCTNKSKSKKTKCEIEIDIYEGEGCEEDPPYGPRDESDQEQKSESKSCPCKQNVNEIEACCKPGCSKRMPCLACTKSGCKAVHPNRSRKQRACKCSQPEQEVNLKKRSRSEFRSKKDCREKPESRSEIKPEKTECKRTVSCGRKSQRKPDTCDDSSESEAVCDSPNDVEARKRSKSPCQKSKACSCDSCKNVKFNDECEVIPSHKDVDSSQDDGDECIEVKPKKVSSKKVSEPEVNNCQCVICLGESQAKLKTKPKCEPSCDDQTFEPQSFSNMSSLITSNFAMPQTFRSGGWPSDVPCPCGFPNCSNTRSMYQQSYQSSPFMRHC